MPEPEAMEHLITGVRDAIAKECWYPALALALMLPDACAAVERPGERISGERYTGWCDTYFAPYVTVDGTPYLRGAELYRLRCRFLHQAELWLTDRRPQHPETSRAMFEVLNEFHLYVCAMDVVPSRGMTEAGPDRTTSYSVGVKDLCEWICSAADDWLRQAMTDPTLATTIRNGRRIMRLHMDASRTPI